MSVRLYAQDHASTSGTSMDCIGLSHKFFYARKQLLL